MVSAATVAATILVETPVYRHVAGHVSSVLNDDYIGVLTQTLHPVPQIEVEDFRTYLQTIPFDFHECQATTKGRMLGSEGDVRLYLEYSAVLQCWPIALAMAPAQRQFDMILRSEKTLQNKTRPDLTVSCYFGIGVNSPDLLAIEFKGPGVLSFCQHGIPAGDCDEWDILTAQLRRYAAVNNIRHVVVTDGCYALYFEFNDPVNEGKPVRYLMASVNGGPVGFSYNITLRELLLFGVYQALPTVVNRRDYTMVIVPAGTGMDYTPVHPVIAVTKPTTADSTSSSTRMTRSSAKRFILMESTRCFPKCCISEDDITPIRDDGFDSGIVSRRQLKVSMAAQTGTRDIVTEVTERCGRVLIPTPSTGRSVTPSLMQDLVMKYYPSPDLLQAYQEATAYSVLKCLQGGIIPYCYGVYDVHGYSGVMLVLEEVHGVTLTQYLLNFCGDEGLEPRQEVEDIFKQCWISVEAFHEHGYAHRDLKGDNVMVGRTGEPIFIDLENVRPVNPISRKMDGVALRLIFSRLGVDEAVVRRWCH